MDSLGTEIRAALRGLRRNPTFTLVAVLTLALGIGVMAAVFGVIDAVLLRPLPFAEPDRLLSLYWRGEDGRIAGSPFGHFRELEAGLADVAEMTWMVRRQVADEIVLRTDTGAELLDGAWVAADLFRVLGVSMAVGPGLPEGANEPGSADVAVLSHSMWRNRFGADPDVVGRTLEINDRSIEVVGVLPADFEYPGLGLDPGVWLPYPVDSRMAEDRGWWATEMIARIADGADAGRVAAEAERLGASAVERYPDDWSGYDLVTTPLQERLVGSVGAGLVLLLAAAGAVLLVACSNLAHLLLARTAERRRELALRIALGAGRLRVARPLLIEALILGIAGGFLGLLAAVWGADALVGASPVPMPRDGGVTVGPRLVLFTVGLSLLSGLLFALVPGLRATRIGYAAMRTGGAGSAAGDHRFRSILVAAESALVLTLLVAAALSLSSLETLLEVDPGFATENRLALTLNLPHDRYRQPESLHAFLTAMEERLAALPGVRAAGAISHLPMGEGQWGGRLFIEGRALGSGAEAPQTDWELASPGYFEAAGIPLLRGRPFEVTDEAGAANVTIVNETLAREYFPDGDVVGRRINGNSPEGPWRTVVGVVADVKQQGLAGRTRPYMYLPSTQVMAWSQQDLVVWVEGDPQAALPTVQTALRDLEPDVAISNARPMEDLVHRSVAGPRFRMLLLGLFGALAVGLGAVGIYGVVAYAMSQRTRELGVRMALGAAPGSLVRTATLQGLRPVAAGMVLGLGGGIAAGRLMASSLYGVESTGPTTLLSAVLVLGAVATVAAWTPARRAARVDPAVSLRTD